MRKKALLSLLIVIFTANLFAQDEESVFRDTSDNALDVRNFLNSVGGFRYSIAKQYGMQAGIDVAAGPEGWAWYIVFGSSWMR